MGILERAPQSPAARLQTLSPNTTRQFYNFTGAVRWVGCPMARARGKGGFLKRAPDTGNYFRQDRSQKDGTHPPDRLAPATRDSTTAPRRFAGKRPQDRFQSPRDLTSSAAVEPSFFRNEGFVKKGPRAADQGRCFGDCAGRTQPLAARPVSEGRAPRD